MKDIVLSDSLVQNSSNQITKDIGIIHLNHQSKMLNNVTVTANTALAMEFGIDRKIFNVEKNITAQGGTAVDVMKNIPSLSVDVDGNVEMRNSTPRFLLTAAPQFLPLIK